MYFDAKIQIGLLMENEARFARKFNELYIGSLVKYLEAFCRFLSPSCKDLRKTQRKVTCAVRKLIIRGLLTRQEKAQKIPAERICLK